MEGLKLYVKISIHAPREGSDDHALAEGPHGGQFQSTLPARGATAECSSLCWTRTISIHAPREGSDNPEKAQYSAADIISIHAPREGSDKAIALRADVPKNFNPRSPRGERR